MKYRVLHVVRRFGPVGGMERYVWRLTSELLELGVDIDILCQSVECDVDPRITLHRIEPSTDRRRWKAMSDFRDKCDQFWLEFISKNEVIVHSHERCTFHQITTFHGPPIGDIFSRSSWWKRIQPRLRAWARFEEEELLGSAVKVVIPVSSRIGDSLQTIYPHVIERLKMPGWPGVDSSQLRKNDGNRFRLIYVGKEWRRKGLDIALLAFKKAREQTPQLTLDVFGVSKSDLPLSFRSGISGVKFHGWQDKIPFENYDLLIHPARVEPFGMIVPEARAAGLAVVISDQVGAADLPLSGVEVVNISVSISAWAMAIRKALDSCPPGSQIRWTWLQLAKWHLAEIYSKVK